MFCFEVTVKNGEELINFGLSKKEAGGEHFLFESGDDLLLAAGTGKIGALFTHGMTGANEGESSVAVHMSRTGGKGDGFVTAGFRQGIFHAGNGELRVSKTGVNVDINAAQEINGFFKNGEVHYGRVIYR